MITLASIKSAIDPPKKEVSVKIDCAATFASKYPLVTSAIVAVSLIIPLEGDWRLNSAIIPVEPTSNKDFFNEKTSLPKFGLSTNFLICTSALILAISVFLNAIILSKMVIL